MNSNLFNTSLFLRWLSTITKHETSKYRTYCCTLNMFNRIKCYNEFRSIQIHYYASSKVLNEQSVLSKDKHKSLIALSKSNGNPIKGEEVKEFPFPLHQYEFWTLQDFYLSMYAASNTNVPTLGIRINMTYVDTAPFANATTPVVVILHGAPGSHEDFRDLLSFLSQQDIRVIIPNFPGYGFTALDHDKDFHHSLEEKSALIKDFLDILKVPRVDVLIGHDAGAYPSIFLCSNFKLFHSIVLINPCGLRPARSLPPQWFLQLCDLCFKTKLLYPLALSLLIPLLSTKKFKSYLHEHTAVTLETIVNPGYKKTIHNATELCLKLYPKAIVFCRDDDLIEPEISLELAETLGCSKIEAINSTEHYLNKHPPQDKQEHFKRVVRIENGGHSAMKTYPSVINSIVMDILKFVRNKQG